jgi:phosphatidylserine/phosphatidylglycerophosphate/cardiolipin synthase-like enzyme
MVSADRRNEIDIRAVPRAVWAARKRLLAAHDATLTPEQRATVVYYLQIGSYNMNDRSMLLDGEVAMTVSGQAATTGMLDFLTIAGLSTWVERQEDIDAKLPPPSGLHRLLARWARSLL